MRTLKVEAAKWSADAGGEWLCLKSSHAAIMAALESIDASKKYVAEIKQERKSRSLNANAYYWRLCGELSAALRIPPNDIYRQHIRDALRTWSGCSPRCRARPVTSVCNGTMGRPERRRRRSSRRRAHAPAASPPAGFAALLFSHSSIIRPISSGVSVSTPCALQSVTISSISRDIWRVSRR